MLATDIETGFDKRRFLAKIALEGEGPAALCRIQYASGRGAERFGQRTCAK